MQERIVVRAVGALLAALVTFGPQSHARGAEGLVSFSPFSPGVVVLSHMASDEKFYDLLADTEHHEEAERYKAAKVGTLFSVTVKGIEFDLNQDGVNELFVTSACGNKACGVALFEGKSLRRIGEFAGDRISIQMTQVHNGFPAICESGYAGMNYSSCYAYSGKTYELKSTERHETGEGEYDLLGVTSP